MSQNETSRRRRTGAAEESIQEQPPKMQQPAAPQQPPRMPPQQPPRQQPAAKPQQTPPAKRGKWVTPLLVVIVILLVIIAVCAGIIVAACNNANTGNLMDLIAGRTGYTPEPTAVPTATPTPAPTPVPTAEPEEETEGSEFERVLMQKGSLIKKEIIDYTSIPTSWSKSFNSSNFDIMLQIATLTDVTTGGVYRALRLVSYFTDGIGILDAVDIDDAIRTLEYIRDHHTEMRDYTEILFTADSGLVIGAYYDGKKVEAFIKYDSENRDPIVIGDIDEIVSKLRDAQMKLLGGEGTAL
ncbi:MAG: hypothetical protein J6K32_11360 [Clostridia bacterium]|nr:hypothetical protein [Clostridia bacterium]